MPRKVSSCPGILLLHLISEDFIIIDFRDSQCDHLGCASVTAIAIDVALVSDSTYNMNLVTAAEFFQAGDFFAFPGRYVVPGGFDDCTAILVLVSEVGCKGKVCYVDSGDFLEPDTSDVASEFDSIKLFHSAEQLKLLFGIIGN